MDLLLQLAADGAANGSHYALLAIGFALIFGSTGIVHFAYGPIYALAAYVGWALAAPAGLGIPLAAGATILITAAIGMLVYLVLYRPFEAQGSGTFVILAASLGLFIVASNLTGVLFGTSVRTFNDLETPIYFLGSIAIGLWQILQMVALLVVGTGLALFLGRTRWGSAIRALADNPEMARIVGIDTERVKVLAFALGSAISAVAAVLILLRSGASPTMGFRAVFIAFVAVVIGGVGSLPGAAIAGLLLGLVESLGMWRIPSEWQSSIAFVLLFVTLLIRPSGLFRGR